MNGGYDENDTLYFADESDLVVGIDIQSAHFGIAWYKQGSETHVVGLVRFDIATVAAADILDAFTEAHQIQNQRAA